jgi:acetyl-CoA carboxylase carboxyltransferase component
MVGPEVERTALVRHCARLFNVGANMTAPLFTVVVLIVMAHRARR